MTTGRRLLAILASSMLCWWMTSVAAVAAVPAMQIGTAALVTPSAALTYYGSPASPTPAATRDPLIQERARALNYDVDLIYRSVRDNVEFVPIFGVQKGARGVYLDNSGTAFDQAHAMVEMLREADAVVGKGYTPTYRYGTITLTGTQFAAWFGVSNADAARAILGDGGIPATVSSTGTTINSVTMAHVWVDAVISGTHYLFDPSYKPHSFTSRINLASAMGYSGTDLVTAAETGASVSSTSILAFNEAAFRTKLNQFRSTLETYLKTNYRGQKTDAVVGSKIIAASPNSELRRTSLPYVISTDLTWSGNIPDVFRTSLTVSLNGSAYGTYFADDFYGKYKAFAYNNNSPAPVKGAVTDKIVGLAQSCDFGNSGTAQQATVTIAINHPYATNTGGYMDRTLSKSIALYRCTNSAFYLSNDWGNGSDEVHRRLGLPAVSLAESYKSQLQIAASLSAVTAQYARYLDLASSELNVTYQLHDLIGLHHIDRIGLDTISDGTFHQGSEQQLITTDFEGGLSVNPTDAVDTARRGAAGHVAASGLDFTENGALREQNDTVRDLTPITLFTGQNSLSAVPGNYYYYLATSANWTTVRDTNLAAYPAALKTILNSYISEGYSLMVPQRGDMHQQNITVPLGSGSTRSTRLVEVYAGSTELTRAVFYAFKPGSAGIDAAAYLIFDPRRGRVLKGGVGVGLVDSAGTLLKNPDKPNPGARAPIFKQLSVDGKTGGFTYAPDVDLSDGFGDFPYRLELKRSYSYGDSTDYGLGAGWRHNWMQTVASANDGDAVMGSRGAQAAAPALVAIWAANDLMSSTASPTRLVGLAHVEKWLADQTTDNVVTVNKGLDGDSVFVRQADGSLLSVKPDGSLLTQTGAGADSIVNRLTYENVAYNYSAPDGSALAYGFVGLSAVDQGEAVAVSSNARKTLYLTSWTLPDGFKIRTTYIYRFDDNLVYFHDAVNSFGRLISVAGGGIDQGNMGTKHATCPNGPNSLIVYEPARDGLASYMTSGGATVTFNKTASNEWIVVPDSEGNDPIRCDAQGRAPNTFIVHVSQMTSAIDPANYSWKYAYLSVPNPYLAFNALGRVFKPSQPSNAALTLAFGNDSNVRSATDLGSNPFAYKSSINRSESDDPLGNASVDYFDQYGRRSSSVNPLGNVTSYAYDARDLLSLTTYPELNSTSYTYDVRSNPTSIVNLPKPGSGSPTITTTTSYYEGSTVAICVNLKTCNRPLQAKDGRLNATDYIWDTSTGNLMSVTQPADADGTRPATNYGYTSFTSGGDTFTLPTSKQDKITSTVTMTTTYAYDAANLYALKDVTVDNPGLALKTCLKLDPAGNLQNLTTPNAALGTCP